jgi:N6-adenosine-specific RNA methylase IME4
MKFRVICADPPYGFSDTLTMSSTKRGAASVYSTLSIESLKSLPVTEIAEDDSVLILWCPSSLIGDGLEIMKAWGFRQTQTHIWVKTKKNPIFGLFKPIKSLFNNQINLSDRFLILKDIVQKFVLDNILSFGMGRLFRQTHEIALIGVRGKIYKHLKNKSQRSVHFFPATKHSVKPEALQDMLGKMFPGEDNRKLEMFARRDRTGWICVGLEAPKSLGEDITISLNRLKNM